MLPLVIAPHPLLRQIANNIDQAGQSVWRALAKQMIQAMIHYDGIGLAAPQVGKSWRLIVINMPPQPTVYFNPEILKKSWRRDSWEEGCLSVPGVWGLVKRPERIYARYQTISGAVKTDWLDGLLARVYQHEVDHLNGVLFIDKTKKFTKGAELVEKYLGKNGNKF